jgi:hypothetical protein
MLQVTGFSNAEEVAVGKDKAVPFSLEDRMKELGGVYSCGPDWAPYALASGKLITGQNPSSSKCVAEVRPALLCTGQHCSQRYALHGWLRHCPIAASTHQSTPMHASAVGD